MRPFMERSWSSNSARPQFGRFAGPSPQEPLPPGDSGSDYDAKAINMYTNFFSDKEKKKPLSGKEAVQKRFKDVEDMKTEEFYQCYKSARAAGDVCTILEPSPSDDLSDGAWEDALRKWKLQINLAMKDVKTKDNSKVDDNLTGINPDNLPLKLDDCSTVGGVLKMVDSKTMIVKLNNIDATAFIDTSRIWVRDHKFKDEVYKIKTNYKDKVNINARRVFIPGEVQYQGVYAHVGLAKTNLGRYKYTESMQKFIDECMNGAKLQEQCDNFAKIEKNK